MAVGDFLGGAVLDKFLSAGNGAHERGDKIGVLCGDALLDHVAGVGNFAGFFADAGQDIPLAPGLQIRTPWVQTT